MENTVILVTRNGMGNAHEPLQLTLAGKFFDLLLQNGRVGFRGLKSKKGTTFAAYFHYVKDENTGRYNWTMEFIDN